LKVYVHTCCAHCFAKTLAGLRAEFGDKLAVRGLWYNPNIHPLIEYRRRLKALRVYLERDPVDVDIVDEYGLTHFFEKIHGQYEVPARCRVCYAWRLSETALRASRWGADAFTTTMITSTHQDHELIRAVGEEVGKQHDVAFLYRDFRDVEVDPKQVKDLYHQQYCGCALSEYDRYKDTTKHLYKGDTGRQ
jgi:hypothetical protein